MSSWRVLSNPSTSSTSSTARRFAPVVLVGVAGDRSDVATGAAGNELARRMGARVHELHVAPNREGEVHPELELRRVAAELDAALQVIGQRSNDGETRGVRPPGTTTRGLLVALERPLWLQRGTFHPPARIIAAIDSPERDRAVLTWGLELASYFRASLTTLHCEDVARPLAARRGRNWFEHWIEDELDRRAGDRDMEIQVLHVAGPPARALAGHFERADLTALGRGARQGLGRVLYGTLAARRGPLLVVP